MVANLLHLFSDSSSHTRLVGETQTEWGTRLTEAYNRFLVRQEQINALWDALQDAEPFGETAARLLGKNAYKLFLALHETIEVTVCESSRKGDK